MPNWGAGNPSGFTWGSGPAPAPAPAPPPAYSPPPDTRSYTSSGGGGGYSSGPSLAAQPYSTAGIAAPAKANTNVADTPYAWMLNIPEVSKVLNEWQQGGQDDTWLKAHIMSTTWYRGTSESYRNAQQLWAQDPATYEAKRQEVLSHIVNMAGTISAGINFDAASDLSYKVMNFGWSDEEIADQLVGMVNPAMGPGMIEQAASQVRQFASQYLVPVDDQTAFNYGKMIASGQLQGGDLEGYYKQMAKSLFPQLTAAIDSGVTVRQFLDPYAQIAGKELGINPQAVDWSDPKWSKAVNQINHKTGAREVMNLSDWTTEIRTNQIYGWDKTQGARDQAADLSGKLLSQFGMV